VRRAGDLALKSCVSDSYSPKLLLAQVCSHVSDVPAWSKLAEQPPAKRNTHLYCDVAQWLGQQQSECHLLWDSHFNIVVHAVLAFASSGPPAFFISTNFARSFSATAVNTTIDPCGIADGLAPKFNAEDRPS
jgi:hypothetical protein